MKITKKYSVCWAIFLLSIFTTNVVLAADNPVGQIVSTYGQVYVSSSGGNQWKRVGKGQYLFPGSSVKTGPYSGASLRMEDESLMRLSQNSDFQVEAVRITSFWRRASALVNRLNTGVTSTYRLLSGKLWGRNNNRNVNAKVFTATATIGIRGTEYVVEADQNSSRVSLKEGLVIAENEFGSVSIKNGEQAVIQQGQAPQQSRVIRTGESVQWTVVVPELINIATFLEKTLLESTDRYSIINAYQQEQYSDALQTLQSAGGSNDINIQLMINWIQLKGGESYQVYQQLTALHEKHTNNSAVVEMLALSAFLNNKIDHANTLISTLNASGNMSDSAWMIDGYIKQSEYDLEAAKISYLKAIEMKPSNNQAKILLSRIYFGSEQTKNAKLLLKQVIQEKPDDSAAQSLYGFILLSDNKTSDAAGIWQTLIDKGDTDADTYFGLSLAQMRQGKVEQAMQNIATAVLLNPQRSMYLSYWGKMLHQIGRYDKALTVLDSAIRLDQRDPTPKLYKAIILQDLNRPGEAIKLIQAAKALNGNQAVYRSRSLLDKDLAVQNVDLSRIYNQLGLSNWAHKLAIQSIKSDFNNASAHILNAGAYAEQPDRAYALGSEALLARMLQPANINSFNTFNRYTSLYETPETEFDVILGAGNHAQKEAWLIATGAKPEHQLAWSFATFFDDSDGWRDVNGEKTENISLITKWQPSQKNNFLFSLSATNFERLDNFSPRYSIDDKEDLFAKFELTAVNIELGLHHKINEHHDLMTYVSLLSSEGELTDNTIDQEITVGTDILTQERLINSDFERPSSQLQFQGLNKIDSHQLFYGILIYDGENNALTKNDYGLFDPAHLLINPLTTFDDQTDFNLDVSYTGVYIQDVWKVTSSLDIDLAIYYEQLDNANAATGGEWEQKETTGRLGAAWQLNNQNTIRIAAFEYLLPFVSSRLDPTDVAGIPIYKNTNEGSLVTEYDIVWDIELMNGLLSFNVFKLEESFLSSALVGTNQVEATTESEKEGVLIDLDYLAGLQTGIHFNLAQFDVKDESNAALDRSETSTTLGITHVMQNGFSISLEQHIRKLEFDTTNTTEDINATNVSGAYEFANKTQRIEFSVLNIADKEFNWITDKFATTGIAPERLAKLTWQIHF